MTHVMCGGEAGLEALLITQYHERVTWSGSAYLWVCLSWEVLYDCVDFTQQVSQVHAHVLEEEGKTILIA